MKIANAPCSWGVLEFELDGNAPDYVQVLDEMSTLGYTGTELGDWGFMPTDAEHLRAELAKRQLKMLGGFVGVPLADPETHAAGETKALQHARLMASAVGQTPFIVLSDENGIEEIRTRYAGRIHPEHGLTPAQWNIFLEGAHRIAQAVKDETGLRTVFHPHCAGYIETPEEIDTLMERTDPNLIGLCFDTGHYRFGGAAEPIEVYKRHADRVWHVHFKDCHPDIAARSREKGWDYFESVGKGVFCELGNGDVDFPEVIAELRKRDYDGWVVVEQDVLPGMGSPYESAERNLKYLNSIV